jgi:hypothetical protein
MKRYRDIITEVAAAVSPADKAFKALHPVKKYQFVKYDEVQFKAGKKDVSRSADIKDSIDGDAALERPKSESEDDEEEAALSESRLDEMFNHREAATHGIQHPNFLGGKDHVGHFGDFYSSKNGDKLYGKVTQITPHDITWRHVRSGDNGTKNGDYHKFKRAETYPGHDSK